MSTERASFTFCCSTISSRICSSLLCVLHSESWLAHYFLFLCRNFGKQFSSTQWHNRVWCFISVALFYLLKDSTLLSILCQFLFIIHAWVIWIIPSQLFLGDSSDGKWAGVAFHVSLPKNSIPGRQRDEVLCLVLFCQLLWAKSSLGEHRPLLSSSQSLDLLLQTRELAFIPQEVPLTFRKYFFVEAS